MITTDPSLPQAAQELSLKHDWCPACHRGWNWRSPAGCDAERIAQLQYEAGMYQSLYELWEKRAKEAEALVEGAAKQIKQIEDDCREAADLRSQMTHKAHNDDFAEAYRRIAFTLEVVGRSLTSTYAQKGDGQ